MSINAYRSARTIVEAPRDAELRLFGQITGELLGARDAALVGAPLVEVLHRNRELWSALSDDCAAPGNALPKPLRASIVSLALWVDRHSSEVARGKADIGDLIEVNRSIMEGLA